MIPLWCKYELVHGRTCSVGVCGSDCQWCALQGSIDERFCGKGKCKEPEW